MNGFDSHYRIFKKYIEVIKMNNKKFNSRNGSDSGSIVRNTLKAHKATHVASVEEVGRVRNSSAFLNMKRERGC